MGIRGIRGIRPQITEELIQKELSSSQYILNNAKYELRNIFVFDWESDFLVMSKAGYWTECEIKISRADFKKDFEKVKKHNAFRYKLNTYKIPNYFYYVVPKNLISIDEVPDYAGLIYYHSGVFSMIKPAPTLHRNKISAEQLNLVDKFYYRYKSLEHYKDNFNKKITDLKAQINSLQQEFRAVIGYDFNDSF